MKFTIKNNKIVTDENKLINMIIFDSFGSVENYEIDTSHLVIESDFTNFSYRGVFSDQFINVITKDKTYVIEEGGIFLISNQEDLDDLYDEYISNWFWEEPYNEFKSTLLDKIDYPFIIVLTM